MGRKGKAQKHTAKEIASKHKAAKEKAGAAGGGGQGVKARLDKMAKKEVKCTICLSLQPTFKSMQLHYDNKHAKDTFPEADYAAQFGKTPSGKGAQSAAAPAKGAAAKPKPKPKAAKKNDLSFLDNY